MNVLILAGGYGTRLKALGEDTSKVLLKIRGRPLVEYILAKIKGLPDLKDIFLVTNNKFYSVFQDWAKQCTIHAAGLRIINDGTNTPEDRLGSIGDIHFVIHNERITDDLLVIGGDNLFDDTLDKYVVFSRQKAPSVTMGVYDIQGLEDAKRFGVVGLDEHQKIINFEEKPAKPQSTLIAMCLYYLPKKSLGFIARYLLESGKSDTAGDYIRWLCGKSDVYGFQFHGKWYDIGSIESYREAQAQFRMDGV